MMKKSIVLSFLSCILASAVAQAAPKEIIGCSIGDALGGLVVQSTDDGRMEIVLQSMADDVPDLVYSTPITPKQISSIRSGAQASFALESKGANPFGGATSHSMLVIFNFDGHVALMAEGGSIYRPTCLAK